MLHWSEKDQEKKEELRKDKWKTKQTLNRIFRQTK